MVLDISYFGATTALILTMVPRVRNARAKEASATTAGMVVATAVHVAEAAAVAISAMTQARSWGHPPSP